MILSLLLLSFTKSLSINAKLERASLEKVQEDYGLRTACLIALQKYASTLKKEDEGKDSDREEEDKKESSQLVEGGLQYTESEEGLSAAAEEDSGQDKESTRAKSASIKEKTRKGNWIPRHKPYSLELGGKAYSVYLKDEGGKLNINALTEEHKDMFQRLLQAEGIDQQGAENKTDSLLDWLDEDESPRPRGAESKYYESLPESYSCRNGKLEFMEELLLVKGIGPEVYEKTKDNLTVYGGGLNININSAPKEVVHAMLRINMQEADEVVAFVKEKGRISNPDELKDLFFKFGVAGKDFEKARALMTTDTTYISIIAIGPKGRKYRLVVDKNGENILAVYPY